MKFQIEQLALCPPDPEAARELLSAMGGGPFVEDHVTAAGTVFDGVGENEADLSFDYSLLSEAKELELLDYTSGPNWMDLRGNADPKRASHLGMHCTEEELAEWKTFFSDRGIGIAQEVRTSDHTNTAIRGKRWYHYTIFDTHPILGIDIKLIVRRNEP